uniref:Crossover junction endodeoxyribonuclease n=1 Tax=Opuntia streptacantha TaxID=393608 RepID=A0A7C9AUA7_OPUST
MGVGGNFWDALKPYARYEGFDFLRDKKVAVDLSFWIVQHEAALKSSYVRNPHIRVTFFRTINLFSKFGAFPVFVVDGKPSPLKSQARIARFIRFSGIDIPDSPLAKERISADRNKYFVKCVEECVVSENLRSSYTLALLLLFLTTDLVMKVFCVTKYGLDTMAFLSKADVLSARVKERPLCNL